LTASARDGARNLRSGRKKACGAVEQKKDAGPHPAGDCQPGRSPTSPGDCTIFARIPTAVHSFLGMGEHYVAVTFDQLKWVDEGVRSTTASTSTAPASGTATNVNGTRTTTGSAITTTSSDTKENWYPDRAVLHATKDQLKSMPEFKY
jgi:hypothetical protein